jgi:hypothetical protein
MKTFILLLTFIWSTSLRAQPVTTHSAPLAVSNDANVDEQSTVAVHGIRDPETKSYRAMLKGVRVFEGKKALAPDATLRFKLRPVIQSKNEQPELILRIVGDHTSIQVPVSPDGTFSIPYDAQAVDDDAEMVLNKKRDIFRWRPAVNSPNIPDDARRLGDLRLECEVLWGVEQENLGFVKRNFLRALGGPCQSSKVNTYFNPIKPVRSATLISGSRTLPLAVANNGRNVYVQLFDSSWDDNSVVKLDFSE